MSCSDTTIYLGGRKVSLGVFDVYNLRSVSFKDESGVVQTSQEWLPVRNTSELVAILRKRDVDFSEFSVCAKGSNIKDAPLGWRPCTVDKSGVSTPGVATKDLLGKRGSRQVLDETKPDGSYASAVCSAVSMVSSTVKSRTDVDHEDWSQASAEAFLSAFKGELNVSESVPDALSRALVGFVGPDNASDLGRVIESGRLLASDTPTDPSVAADFLSHTLASGRMADALSLVSPSAKTPSDPVGEIIPSFLRSNQGSLEASAALLGVLGFKEAVSMFDAVSPSHASLTPESLAREMSSQVVKAVLAASLEASQPPLSSVSTLDGSVLLRVADHVAGPMNADAVSRLMKTPLGSIDQVRASLSAQGVSDVFDSLDASVRSARLCPPVDNASSHVSDEQMFQAAVKSVKFAQWVSSHPTVADSVKEQLSSMKNPVSDKEALFAVVRDAVSACVSIEERGSIGGDLRSVFDNPSSGRVDSVAAEVRQALFTDFDASSPLVAALCSDNGGHVMLRTAVASGLSEFLYPSSGYSASGSAHQVASGMVKPLYRLLSKRYESQDETSAPITLAQRVENLKRERLDVVRDIANSTFTSGPNAAALKRINNELLSIADTPDQSAPYTPPERSDSLLARLQRLLERV
jgi:hypothetical protein